MRRMIDILAEAWEAVEILRRDGCEACGAKGTDSWCVTRGSGTFDTTCRNCGARRELPPLPEQLELIT